MQRTYTTEEERVNFLATLYAGSKTENRIIDADDIAWLLFFDKQKEE